MTPWEADITCFGYPIVMMIPSQALMMVQLPWNGVISTCDSKPVCHRRADFKNSSPMRFAQFHWLDGLPHFGHQGIKCTCSLLGWDEFTVISKVGLGRSFHTDRTRLRATTAHVIRLLWQKPFCPFQRNGFLFFLFSIHPSYNQFRHAWTSPLHDVCPRVSLESYPCTHGALLLSTWTHIHNKVKTAQASDLVGNTPTERQPRIKLPTLHGSTRP
jgi:hypothetical protein